MVISSCSDKVIITNDASTEKIDFANLKKNSIDEFIAQMKSCYILLKPTKEDQKLSFPEKILYKDGIYYMLNFPYHRNGFLVAYDAQGNGISRIGAIGNSDKEYWSINDFTVTDDGIIYAIDGRIDKLFKYDRNFKCVQDIELPFEADVIEAINDTTLLFGLSSWNRGKGKGYKIVEGDAEGNIKHSYSPYDKYVDFNFIISNYNFVRSSDCIAYNQTINDSIYIFDFKGNPTKVINLNFGSETVPNRMKTNVERYLKTDFNTYNMLRKIFYISKHYIVGEILYYKGIIPFVLDIKTNNIYFGNDTIKQREAPLVGVANGGLIFFLNKEDKSLPDSVNNHLKNGGVAFKISKLE